MDLRHAAMLTVAQGANQRDHVEAELMLRQHDRALRFRPVGPVVVDAASMLAATNLQPQAHQPSQGRHRAAVLVADRHPPPAARTAPPKRP